MKKPDTKKQHIVWFPLCEMSKTGNAIEVESWLMVVKAWGKWRVSDRVWGFFGADDDAVELDSGDDCATW